MAHCHLKLAMVLLPLYPAVPVLAQAGPGSNLVPSAPPSSDLVITETGSVVRSPTATGTGKLIDRVPQGSTLSHPADVQMAFVPSAAGSSERGAGAVPPCPGTPPALSPSEAEAMVRRVAEQERFHPDFVLAVAKQESRFKVDALSEKGAYGLMQLMSATAKQFNVDRCDPEANVRGGIRFLRGLHQRYRNPLYVLAAYNAGESALREHGGIPPFPETVAYVATVLNDFYGYPGISAAIGSATSSRVAPSRVGIAAPAAPRRSTRQTLPSEAADKAKPGDWLVLHVE
jgi:hypothetical protein